MSVAVRKESPITVEAVDLSSSEMSSATFSPRESGSSSVTAAEVVAPTVQSTTSWSGASISRSDLAVAREQLDPARIRYETLIANGELIGFSRNEQGMTVTQFRQGDVYSLIFERDGKTATLNFDCELKTRVQADGTVAVVTDEIATEYTMDNSGKVRCLPLYLAPPGKKIADVEYRKDGKEAVVRILAA